MHVAKLMGLVDADGVSLGVPSSPNPQGALVWPSPMHVWLGRSFPLALLGEMFPTKTGSPKMDLLKCGRTLLFPTRIRFMEGKAIGPWHRQLHADNSGSNCTKA